MADLTAVDGTTLSVLPIAVLDRDGTPYEVTLELRRDGQVMGAVGERCGYFLAETAARLRVARAAGAEFPPSNLEAGLRGWAADAGRDADELWDEVSRYLPRDRELFCFRARDPDDRATVGELRVTTEVERRWDDGWQLSHLAVLRAWGERGAGMTVLLTSYQLLAFLDELIGDFTAVGAVYDATEDAYLLRRPIG